MQVRVGDTVEGSWDHGSYGVVEDYAQYRFGFNVRWADGTLEKDCSHYAVSLVKATKENAILALDNIIDGGGSTDLSDLQEQIQDLAFLVKQLYKEQK